MGNEFFCIYCGSQEVKKIVMEKKEGNGPRTITLRMFGVEAGLTGKHFDSNAFIVPETYFCSRCNMIMTSVERIMEPGIVELTDESGHNIKIILPESLLIYFVSFKLQENEIKNAVSSIYKRLMQILKKFDKTGTNPCKNGKIGSKAKMLVRKTKVNVYVLVENNRAGKSARIIYGGGWSYCK